MNDVPTQKQVEYAKYLADRMRENLPKEYTRTAYSDFISRWAPVVKAEDQGMSMPMTAWQLRYM